MTPKQARFADEYLVDLNARQAAIRAGFSARTAHAKGHTLLQLPEVQARIAELQAERAKRTEITADMVIQELAKIGFASMENYSRLCGAERVIDLSATTSAQLAAVSELTVEDYKDGRGEDARDVRRTRIKLADKVGALEKIGHHLGMFVKKLELGGPKGGPIPMASAPLSANSFFSEERLRRMTPEQLAALEAAMDADS